MKKLLIISAIFAGIAQGSNAGLGERIIACGRFCGSAFSYVDGSANDCSLSCTSECRQKADV